MFIASLRQTQTLALSDFATSDAVVLVRNVKARADSKSDIKGAAQCHDETKSLPALDLSCNVQRPGRSTVGGGKARSVGRGQEIRRELRAKRFTSCEKRGLHQNLDNVLRKKVCSFCSSPTGLEVCLPERSIHQLETGLP